MILGRSCSVIKLCFNNNQRNGEKNNLVIASGITLMENLRKIHLHVVLAGLLDMILEKYGLEYPSWYGFESYIVYKALIDNYQIRVVKSANSWSQRKTGKTTNYKNYGKAMRAFWDIILCMRWGGFYLHCLKIQKDQLRCLSIP